VIRGGGSRGAAGVRLKLSAEPMSGFVAPARTTTPYFERAIPICESGKILPLLISPAKDPGGAAMTSNASPELIRRVNSALRPVVVLSLCPEFFFEFRTDRRQYRSDCPGGEDPQLGGVHGTMHQR
jgi:hypothetical protein